MTDPADLTEPVERFQPLPSGVELHTLQWSPPDGIEGGERTWVLTHGLASNARLWDGVARRLAVAGHEVVTVDQRGHGRSSKPDDGYDMATCADDLALLIDALELERPAVGGQSWGGNVVLELARRHPGSIDQIACVDGGFIDLRSRFSEWEDCKAALSPPRLAGTPVDTMRTWLDESAGDWPTEGREATMANFEVRDDGTIAPWLTFERHLKVLRGLWEHTPSEVYPDVEVPTLLIAVGDADTEWTAWKRQAIDDARTALRSRRIRWFHDAHHDVHAQRPDAVAAVLHAATTEPGFFSTDDSEDTT